MDARRDIAVPTTPVGVVEEKRTATRMKDTSALQLLSDVSCALCREYLKLSNEQRGNKRTKLQMTLTKKLS